MESFVYSIIVIVACKTQNLSCYLFFIFFIPRNTTRTPACILLFNSHSLIVICGSLSCHAYLRSCFPQHMSVMNTARSQKSTGSHRWIREMQQLGRKDINLIYCEHDGIWYTGLHTQVILHLCRALEHSEVFFLCGHKSWIVYINIPHVSCAPERLHSSLRLLLLLACT